MSAVYAIITRVAKKVTDRTILGDKGIALIHRRVLDMGFVWHPRAMDAGIDGEISERRRR